MDKIALADIESVLYKAFFSKQVFYLVGISLAVGLGIRKTNAINYKL